MSYTTLFTDQLLYWDARLDDSINKASLSQHRNNVGLLLAEEKRFEEFFRFLELIHSSSNPCGQMRALITQGGRPSPNNYSARKGPWWAVYYVDHIASSINGLKIIYDDAVTSLMNAYSPSIPPGGQP
jgi:hypothetical protein